MSFLPPPNTGPACPCCGEPTAEDVYGDGEQPFCWDCGIYISDPARECDNEDHIERTRS